MTVTPDQAGDLLPGTTPGPWMMHRDVPEDFIRVTGDDLKDIAANGVVEDADARLIAAAPDLAQTVAGMTEEWGVRFPDASEWWPGGDSEKTVRAAKLANNVRFICRLVSATAVIED